MCRPVSAVAIALLLAACSSVRETQPGRTATEQLLFSTAADRAADKLALAIPDGTKVFVDPAYVEGTDSKYLLGAVRDRILRRGGQLMPDRASADLVIEPRIGAISVDRNTALYGMPEVGVPVPLADIETPEIALFKRDTQQGVVKLALTMFDAKSGKLVQPGDPVYGFAYRTDWKALLFISWETNDLVPEPEKQQWIGRGR